MVQLNEYFIFCEVYNSRASKHFSLRPLILSYETDLYWNCSVFLKNVICTQTIFVFSNLYIDYAIFKSPNTEMNKWKENLLVNK